MIETLQNSSCNYWNSSFSYAHFRVLAQLSVGYVNRFHVKIFSVIQMNPGDAEGDPTTA